MVYRTKTYIAADWDNDIDAVNQLLKWNESEYYSGIDFVNVHEFIQARDSSYPCSIKQSLSQRMDMCKLFILIVGDKTNSVTKGSCNYCGRYRRLENMCFSNRYQNNKSFIDFECDRAKRDFLAGKIKILVLYNSSYVYKDRCPESLRNIGVHYAMKTNGNYDYQKVKFALFDLGML